MKRVAKSTRLRQDLAALPGLRGRPVFPTTSLELQKGLLFFAASSYIVVKVDIVGVPPWWAEAPLSKHAGGGDVPVRTIGASGDWSLEQR